MWQFFLSIFLVGIIGCASVKKNHDADLKSSPHSNLLLSGEINKSYSSEYFAIVEFTIENNSKDWIEIQDVDLTFPDSIDKRNVFFPFHMELRNGRALSGPKNYHQQRRKRSNSI